MTDKSKDKIMKIRDGRLIWIARNLGLRYFQDGVAGSSAALAYYLLFSFFPMLIFLNTVISTLNISMPELMEQMEKVLPQEVQSIISSYLSYISRFNPGTLLYAGIFLTAWMLTRSIGMLMSAVSRAYRVKTRTKLYVVVVPILSILLLISVFVLLAISMVSTRLLVKVNDYIRLPGGFIKFWGILRTALAPIYLFFMLASFYWIAGNRHDRFRASFPGAAAALATWMLATWGFSYYVSNLGRYSVLYGSLGAMIVLMLWLYLTGTVLIMGGELNDLLARHKALHHKEEQ